MNLKISLVISTYNREDALELVLLSVLRQSAFPFEVIIADDGSTSDTAGLIEKIKVKFPVPLHHCWHQDKGFRLAHIRNKAMATAVGNYIVMVDGDIVLHRHFIRDHRDNAATNQFIQGSRVLLSKEITRQSLEQKKIEFTPLSKDITNRLNAVSCKWLSPVASGLFSRSQTHEKVRGCNMSFWKSDLEKVNGFSEEFVGWGREDSEFVVRMLNNGIKRYNLKFGGVAYHLWHEENKTNSALLINDLSLAKAIAEKRLACQVGINQYLSGESTHQHRN